jgi:hypothetical protein
MAPHQVATKYPAAPKRKGIRLRHAMRAIARSGADAGRRPVHCELECAENDYYRFLNYPRD